MDKNLIKKEDQVGPTVAQELKKQELMTIKGKGETKSSSAGTDSVRT